MKDSYTIKQISNVNSVVVPYLESPKWSTNEQGTKWVPGEYSTENIPSGVYSVVFSYSEPPFLKRIQFMTDSIIDLPDDPTTEVMDHIKDFWDKEPAFRSLGVTYKRGILLYGPPGSGKSATIYRLADILVNHNVVMILAKSVSHAETAITYVKSLEPNRKLLVIFEDIDGIINRYGDEELTHLLDGGIDVDNVLFLATTNYPSRIPARVLNRPSRFDVLMEIAMPSYDARVAYITHLLGNNLLIDIDNLAQATDNLSIAEIKEVIILTQIFNYDLATAIDKMTSKKIPNY